MTVRFHSTFKIRISLFKRCRRRKIVPILIRYFKPNSGIQIKVFEVTNLKGETANILSTYIIESLKKHKLSDKIIAFSGDNCNTNFGGVLRKGSNNDFSILNNNLKTNIFGVGCAAHILHNAMQSSADVTCRCRNYSKQNFSIFSYIYNSH